MDTLVNYTYTSFRAIFVLSAKGSKDGLFVFPPKKTLYGEGIVRLANRVAV